MGIGAVAIVFGASKRASMTPAFELSKWYADCLTDVGDALIIYHARLRWRTPTIHYSNLLIHEPGRPARSRFSLRNQPAPIHKEEIKWKSPAWNAEGSWRKIAPAVREILFDSAAGSVEWNCVAPRSSAEVRIGEGRPYRGYGYVEHLRVTIPPWRLPIRQLRWGRFVNACDALVWIDWRGSYNKQVVYYNGSLVSASAISDGEIALADGGAVLKLNTSTTLREGVLGATALSVLPNIERLFPASILGIHECKWLSRAVLRRHGQPDSVGMAIHEVVEWP
jgi:hypothetical protein